SPASATSHSGHGTPPRRVCLDGAALPAGAEPPTTAGRRRGGGSGPTSAISVSTVSTGSLARGAGVEGADGAGGSAAACSCVGAIASGGGGGGCGAERGAGGTAMPCRVWRIGGLGTSPPGNRLASDTPGVDCGGAG